MSCPTELQGIGLTCTDSMGGIKRVLIALRSDVKSITLDEATGTVTAIEMEEGKTFKEFSFRKQTGSLTSTRTIDDAAASNFTTSELTLQFSKADSVKRLAIEALIAANSVVIVETQLQDEDGALSRYQYMGLQNPVTCTASTSVTGTAFGDLNGYTITLQDLEPQYPPFVKAEIVDALVA